jgi:hypothetical protein
MKILSFYLYLEGLILSYRKLTIWRGRQKCYDMLDAVELGLR